MVGILPRPRPGSSGDSSERDSASLPQAFPSARRPVSILALATGKLGPALSLESLGFCHLLHSLLLLRGFSILSSHLSNLVVHNFYQKLPLTSSKADRIYVINRNKSRGNLPMLLSYFWSYHKPGLGVCDQFSIKHFMHRHVLKLFSVKDPDAVVLDSQLKTFKGKGCRHGYFKQRLCATPHLSLNEYCLKVGDYLRCWEPLRRGIGKCSRFCPGNLRFRKESGVFPFLSFLKNVFF